MKPCTSNSTNGSVDPDQTSTLFVEEASKTFSRRQKQMTFIVIGALRGRVGNNYIVFLSIQVHIYSKFQK